MEGLETFAVQIVHEMNNLLMAAAGSAEVASELLSLDDPAQKYVKISMEASIRASELAQQILAYARRKPAAAEPQNMNELLLGMEQILRHVLDEKNSMTLQLSVDLLPVLAVSGKLDQVVINLVLNARDAMPDGGTVTIATSHVTAGDPPGDEHWVVLTVSDTGTGIAPEIVSELFKPFFTTKPVGKGTGLGLSIVQQIVEECGGHIRVESELGKGASFRIFLPVAAEG